jgi:hypothetical protein
LKLEDPVVHKIQESKRKKQDGGLFRGRGKEVGSRIVDDSQLRRWGFQRWDATGSAGPPSNRVVRKFAVWIWLGIACGILFAVVSDHKRRADRPLPNASALVHHPPPTMDIPPAPNTRTPVTTPEQLFRLVSPGIVVVDVFAEDGRRVSQGSGVVVRRGHVITNRHVIERGTIIRVRQSGKSYAAAVQYADTQFDLCELVVNGLPADPVAIGTVESLSVGQRVYAIGAPHGLELSISEGLVSSLRHMPGTLTIQTTAAISNGSSGGALFDADGFLVGITTFVLKDGQNLNFALPADLIHGLPARAAVGNGSQHPTTHSVSPPPPPKPETVSAPITLEDMNHFVQVAGEKAGFRLQASFNAYNGYIIINPADLDEYPRGKSVEIVQSFMSAIGRTVYDKGLADEDYKLYVQIQGEEYFTTVRKCRQRPWKLLEKTYN